MGYIVLAVLYWAGLSCALMSSIGVIVIILYVFIFYNFFF